MILIGAAKKGDQEALSRLRAQREQLVTPITAKVDADDETIDMSTDEGSLTIENEEETKSGKFYDPVKRRHHLVVLPKTSSWFGKVIWVGVTWVHGGILPFSPCRL